jgi:hypothetical protein
MSSEDLIREAQDPATSAARLAELAQADRSTWPAIVFHPAAYDGLLQWLGERGDPTVNAVLAARAAQLASVRPPVEEQTAVIPPEPAPQQTAPQEPVQTPEATSEPTAVIPAQPAYPAAQPAYPTAYPAAGAPTAAFGSVPPGGSEHQPSGDGTGKGGKPLAFVIAMVVVIIALIGGAAYGATQLFGDDDDDGNGISATSAPRSATPAPEKSTAATPDAPAASSDFCTSMKTLQDQSMSMLGNSGATPDLGSIQDLADDMIQSYKDLEQSAPEEIKGDIRSMSSYLDMLKNPTGDAAENFDMTEYTEAAQRVGVYYAKNCL